MSLAEIEKLHVTGMKGAFVSRFLPLNKRRSVPSLCVALCRRRCQERRAASKRSTFLRSAVCAVFFNQLTRTVFHISFTPIWLSLHIGFVFFSARETAPKIAEVDPRVEVAGRETFDIVQEVAQDLFGSVVHVCVCVRLCVCVSVCLSVCLSV